MKKSELLALLKQDIKDAAGNLNLQASMVLERCLSVGMLPPEAADFNIGNNWEPESTVEELNKIGKIMSNQINAELLKSRDTLVDQCYDILKEYEEPYGKSVVEQVNAEIKELNRIVDSLKENE